MRLFLDLDGPILDVSRRYHRVHEEIVAGHGLPALSPQEFWERKRRAVPVEQLIAGAADLTPSAYRQVWLARVEQAEVLVDDRLVPGAREVLAALAGQYRLCLVTLRRNGETLHQQLETLGLLPVFDRILWGQTDGIPPWQSKVERIREAGLDGGEGVFVGDSEVDVRAGKELGMVTIATANGIRTAPFLAQVAGADIVLTDLTTLPATLERLQEQGVVA